MQKSDSKIINLAQKLLTEATEANRYRSHEINKGVDGERKHAEVVCDWVEKLMPNPSIALRIAALFHDVDRIITPGTGFGFKGELKGQAYYDHKKAHAKRSADYICDKIREYKIDKSLIERIRFLIIHHDDLGEEVKKYNDQELNILVAADSFAFYTTVASFIYRDKGEKALRDKIIFMISKMPDFAKELLAKTTLENPLFEKIKNEILSK